MKLRECDSSIQLQLSYLRSEEKYIRDLKKFLERELFRLQMEELNLKGNIRSRRIQAKIKLEEGSKVEKEHNVEILPTNQNNVNGFHEPNSESSIQYLEPLNLNTPDFEEFAIDSN